jgi:signal transduction histidine kinase
LATKSKVSQNGPAFLERIREHRSSSRVTARPPRGRYGRARAGCPGTSTETSRLQHLVDALLLLARYDDSAPLNRREHLDLAALAREVVAAVPADVAVEVHLDVAVPLSGDPDQLNRLVRNLLDNAVRHARTKVSVTVTTDGAHTALIEVADDGPGIPTADRERVFDRFVRLQSARTRHHGDATGTGLGLSIARDITTAHGGSITVADTPDGPGALFVVRLPIEH